MIVSFVHTLFLWLGDSAIGTFMRDSTAPSSIAVVLHLLGLILLGGTTLLVSLAALNRVLHRPSAARVDRELWPFYLAGLTLTALTGVAMVSSKAEHYFYNEIFWLKLALLAPAAAISLLLHRHLRHLAAAPVRPRWRFFAGVNVLLWTGVTVAGRSIGLF